MDILHRHYSDAWVLYGSEGFKSAFFLVCTWSRETTKLAVRYKHTHYLCMCEFLPESFTCICKGENLSIRCFYLSMNDRVKIYIQREVLHSCELIFLSGWLFSLSPLCISATAWKLEIILLTYKCHLEADGFLQYKESLSFHWYTSFPITISAILHLLEAEVLVTCRQREAPLRRLPAAGPGSPAGLLYKGSLSSGFSVALQSLKAELCGERWHNCHVRIASRVFQREQWCTCSLL